MESVDVVFEYSNSDIAKEEYVDISFDLCEKLGFSIGNKNQYVSVNFLEYSEPNNSRVFKLNNITDNLGERTIQIFNYTNIDNVSLTKAFIRRICKLVNIEHMIIAIDNENLFATFKSDFEMNFENLCKLFKLEIDRNNEFLIHVNDIILLGDDIAEVVHLEPLSQGILQKSTRLTVVFNNDIMKNESKKKSTKLKIKNNILSVDGFAFTDFDSFDTVSNEIDSDQRLSFCVKPLKQKIKYFNPEPLNYEDDELFAFISFEKLLKSNFSSGDYCEVSFIIENDIKVNRLVKLIAFPEESNSAFISDDIYVSPIAYLNMNCPSRAVIAPNSEHFSYDYNSMFVTAKSVNISRIATPISLNKTFQAMFLLQLKRHFEIKKRIIHKGMIIAVPIDTVLSKGMFLKYGDISFPSSIPAGDPNDVVFFMITDIDDTESTHKQYLLDTQKTKMIQAGVVQDFSVWKLSDKIDFYKYMGLPPVFKYLSVIDRVKAKNPKTNVFESSYKLVKLLKAFSTSTKTSKRPKVSAMLYSHTRSLGKLKLISSICLELGVNFFNIDCYDLLQGPGNDLKTVGTIYGKLESILTYCKTFTVIFFRHLDAFTSANDTGSTSEKDNLIFKFLEAIEMISKENPQILVVASSNNYEKLNDEVKNFFNFNIEMQVPNEDERQEIFEFYLENINYSLKVLKQINLAKFVVDTNVSKYKLAVQSAGLTPIDISAIVRKAKNSALQNLRNLSTISNASIDDLICGNGGSISVKLSDFEIAINGARDAFSESINAPKIPSVRWEDVGGLDFVKDEILDTIELPMKNPYLFSNGLKKRSGILFYGPPGTGKTLLAKAIATNFSLNFFSVKGPELLNMYIGESEANVRRVFQRARDAKPCVVFFDELDSVAPKRGNQGDSGGVMDRIVSQLLAELDGMSDGDGGDGVFVIGATNRPDLLDEALLRPGRFDKMLYLGISDTHDKQLKIVQALTRKFNLHDDVNLESIVDDLPFNYTGADFYALSSDSMLNAMTRKAFETDKKICAYNKNLPEGSKEVSTNWWFENIASDDDIKVFVRQQDFVKAKNELNPSVSEEELHHYLRIRKNFEGTKTK